jgi:hypothetical protein
LVDLAHVEALVPVAIAAGLDAEVLEFGDEAAGALALSGVNGR